MKFSWVLLVLALSCTRKSEDHKASVVVQTATPVDGFDPAPKVTITENLPDGLNGSWTASLGAENRCNIVYEIQSADSKLKTTMSCLDSHSHSIRREERIYQYAIGKDSLLNLTLQESTCPRESIKADLVLQYKLGTLDSGEAALILQGRASYSRIVTLVKSSEKVDPQFLAATSSYRTFAFQKGCFAQGQVNRFIAIQP